MTSSVKGQGRIDKNAVFSCRYPRDGEGSEDHLRFRE